MWWDESERKWKRHPMCRCGRDCCICRNLPMLDERGNPIYWDDDEASVSTNHNGPYDQSEE